MCNDRLSSFIKEAILQLSTMKCKGVDVVKVVMISGKAQHGKDTVARFLKTALEANGYSVLVTHYGDLVKYVCKTFFGWDGNKDEHGRTLLQHIGTDIIRKQDENYWVRFVGQMLTFFNGIWDYVLIPDCRFPNEVDYLKEIGLQAEIIHVRVIRSGFISPLTKEQQSHLSEIALDAVAPDYCIYNDGSLNDLRLKVIRFAADMISA